MGDNLESKDNIIELTDDELEKAFTDDAYKLYTKEISRYPILSIEQQKRLGQRYKENNDQEARELLINCNLRLVISIALRYKSRLKHLQIMDTIQDGNLGLIRAIETYDPEKSAFTTYAVPWIEQRITRAIANTNEEIRKPVHFQEDMIKYLQLVKDYNKLGKPLPSDDILCENLNISMNNLKSIRETLNQNTISINQNINDDGKSKLENFIIMSNHDYDNVINQIDNDNMLLVLKEVLKPLQYFVIYYRFLSDEQKTLEEVAAYFNLTRERVRQIEASTLKKLKIYLAENSSIFRKTLDKIKQREGYKFSSLKTTPLSPIQIIRYMYLKDDLSDKEKKLYELNLIGKYRYRNSEYAAILEITLQELKQVTVSLKRIDEIINK